ncbi:glycosyltransferase [Xanthomarina gelatinilytica]|uniref:glycosyltransferase n=1 Tax=Xanthomarina gelatinilytica TaxID=1137281 RepID=UPI003AA91FE1
MGRKAVGVSVIVCCYNSSLRLPKTLSYLATQEVAKDQTWELILVNNNSTDTTVAVAEQMWKQLGAPVHLTIVEEHQAGLTFARAKGVSVSQYDLLLFCDDDNWLQADYIQQTLAIFNSHPDIGALGGWSEAVFEDGKPDWFDRFAGNFAVGKPMKESGLIHHAQGFLYGAGMVIHKDTFALLKKIGFKSILTDRKGKQLSSGGDVELIYAMKLLGVPVMFSDRLLFYHFMPKERMTWEYLLKLRQSMYWSNFILNIYIDALLNKPMSLIWMVKKYLKSIRYIYTKNQQLSTMDNHKKLLLSNQIAIRRLFLKHPWLYYKTRLSLKKLQNA